MLWRTVHETPLHQYQQHRLTKRRRAVAKTDSTVAPRHKYWLQGGELTKRPRAEKIAS